MSNVKELNIVIDLPYDWPQHLEGEDADLVAVWFLSPPINISIDYTRIESIPNKHGGRTAMYRATIHGTEAIRVTAIAAIIDALLKAGGKLVSTSVYDIEAEQDLSLAVHLVEN
jgi:hypothetical protein